MLRKVELAIEALSKGKIIIVKDSIDGGVHARLICAAQKATAETINFMVTHGRGLVFQSISEARRKFFNLQLIGEANKGRLNEQHAVSIEAAEGVSTGISAADRAATIAAMCNRSSEPSALVQPGHVFPLVADTRGFEVKQGFVEAGNYLAERAGFNESSVQIDILDNHGELAQDLYLDKLSKIHSLPMISIADLAHFFHYSHASCRYVDNFSKPGPTGAISIKKYIDNNNGQSYFLLEQDLNQQDSNIYKVDVHFADQAVDMLGLSEEGKTLWPLYKKMDSFINDKQSQRVLMVLPCFSQKEAKQCDGEKPRATQIERRRIMSNGMHILRDAGINRFKIYREDGFIFCPYEGQWTKAS